MHEVSVRRVIDVPVDDVWRIIDDFGGVYRYHPLVEKSPIQNGIRSGLGAERACLFDDGNQIRERITAHEPGHGYTIEITDPGRFPLKAAVARLSVQPLGEERSRVGFDMSFQPTGGPLGWFMAKAVMERQFRKVLGRVLEGIEAHARTGEVVSRRRPRTAA